MRSRWSYHLYLLELIGKLSALLAGQKLLQARHVFIGFVLDVVMQILKKSVEKGHEFWLVDRHVLKLVEIIFDLVVFSIAKVNGQCGLRIEMGVRIPPDAAPDPRLSDPGLPDPCASPLKDTK